MLLAILIMMTLMIIAATAIAPRLATQIKREREQELIHRGKAYVRAIKLYYRKFGRYPTKIEDLENTNTLRFLRKRYKDPITGKDEWRLIHYGEVKTPVNLPAMPGSTPGSSNMGSPLGSGGGGPTGGGTAGSSTDSSSKSANSSSGSTSGQTFGGGPIVGVASTSEAESLMELSGNTHYNQWEFVYDPRFDVAGMAGGIPNPNPKPNPNPNPPK